jgi:predicted nucleotidyltransferase
MKLRKLFIGSILKLNSDKFEPVFLETIQILKEITNRLNVPFILIGASARDIIFEHLNGIKAPRITMDIDIAVEIATWDSFDNIKHNLLNKYDFSETDQLQRFKYKNFLLDIVPYGRIAENGRIIWRENLNSMSIAGFSEIYVTAQSVSVNTYPSIEFKIPTLEGLAILKFLSWNDAYPVRPKDAEDILFMLKNYERTLDTNEIFEKYPDIIEKAGFDLTQAGLIILGSRIKEICGKTTFQTIKDILEKETDPEGDLSLLIQMHGDIDVSRELLLRLHEGINS